MTRLQEQAVARAAAHECLQQELIDALGVALKEWSGWYDDCCGQDAAEVFDEYRRCQAVLAKAKGEQHA